MVKPIRIAFIGGFERLYDEEGKALTFEKLGCEVLRVEEKDFGFSDIDKVINWRPDFILSAKYVIPDKMRDTLFFKAKNLGIKTVAWHPDLYHFPSPVCNENRLAMITNKMNLWACDYIFSPDGCLDSDSFYKNAKVNHTALRQAPYDETVGIYDQADISDITDKEEIPILFVGSLYNVTDVYRKVLLDFLTKTYGEDFLWVGQTEHQVREERLSTLISRSKIVIGDSFYFPGYWSNRIYETIGRGGFMIHPYVPQIEKEFVPNKECVFYNRWDFRSLDALITYFLGLDDHRQEIVSAGMERVKKDHTLLNRCEELLKVVL